jgi:hypothetical protein
MENEEFKLCLFCKEKIRINALKCRFCGEWLDPSELPTSKQPEIQEGTKNEPPEVVKTPPVKIQIQRKSVFNSPFNSWAEGINKIPIPHDAKVAKSLILCGMVMFFAAFGLIIYLGKIAEKTNHHNGRINIAFLFVLGMALTGVAMLLRGAWFFFASTYFCKIVLEAREALFRLSFKGKVISGIVLLLISIALFVFLPWHWLNDNHPLNFSLILLLALGLGLLGYALIIKGIITLFTTTPKINLKIKKLQTIYKMAEDSPLWLKLILSVSILGVLAVIAVFLFKMIFSVR